MQYMFFFGWLASFSIFFLNLPASAGDGFTVTPVFFDITLHEEEQYEFEVTVSNETASLSTFRLSTLDFGSLDESGGVAFLGASNELEKKYALASWMRPETDTLILLPGKSETVKVRIENRPDLSPGGHYAALIFSSADTATEIVKDNRIAVNQIFSVLVFVKKRGGERYDLKLVEQQWTRGFFSYDDKLRLRFNNAGNVHLVPRGVITLSDPRGRTVAEGIINEESSIILPESFRVYPVKLKAMGKVFLPGKYTLSIAWRYDGEPNFTVTEEVFDFFPPLAILSILPVIVGAGWYVARKRKNTGVSVSKKGAV